MENLTCPESVGGSDNVDPTDPGSALFYASGQCLSNTTKRNCLGISSECEGVAWELNSGYRTSGLVTCNKTAHGGRLWQYERGWSTSGVAAAVLSRVGAIGYASLTDALAFEVQTVTLVNRAGTRVAAGAQSVSFALLELGGQLIEDGSADLNDLNGLYVWPIVGLSYVLLRTGIDQQTQLPHMDDAPVMFDCELRARTVDFLEWLLLSPTSVKAGESLGYTMMPEFIAKKIFADIVDLTHCDALSPRRVRTAAVTVTSNFFYTAPQSYALVMALIAASSAVEGLLLRSLAAVKVAGATRPLAWLQPVVGEPTPRSGFSIGLAMTGEAAGVDLAGVPASSSVVALPLFFSGIVPLYHLTSNAFGLGAGQAAHKQFTRIDVELSLAQLAGIFLGTVGQWSELDPALPATNITVVFDTE
ncbi:hypothetical protein T492DRAFT_882833, partial [Pavlovales sp. CCMP2436]